MKGSAAKIQMTSLDELFGETPAQVECVAEFFQTGMIYLAVLDPFRMEYVEHEIRQLTIRPEDVSSLLRALYKVQNPAHDMISRWKDPADRERWTKHIRKLHRFISQLQ